jgi:hypothetical protein
MNRRLIRLVHERAGERCEYCRLPQTATRIRLPVDHVIALKHGGPTHESNLALCCDRCNSFKGRNLTGIDPQTGLFTQLLHPRRDRWAEHFAWEGAMLVGLTDVGRTTISVLNINEPVRVALRKAMSSDELA